MVGSYQASCWLRCWSMRLLTLYSNIWAVRWSCGCSYFPWYLPFLPGLLLPCHPSPVPGGDWHGFPSAPECFRASGPLLHPFLLTLSWISLPWLSLKCLTVIHNTRPATAFRYVIEKTSKGLFHWQCLYTFHWNLREYLLPQVLQNRLLWLSWFLVTCRAATTWLCVGILSTETLLPCWQAILRMSNALAPDQPHLNRQCLLLRQHPSGSHILCHIFSWKIDKLHKRLSAKLYSQSTSRTTVPYYKSNLK